MSSNILKADNGVSSGTTGLVYTAGNDGTLQLATTTSGGSAVTALTINNSQIVTFANQLTAASMPTGSVIQVVQSDYNTMTSSVAGSFVSTGLTASITPQFSTSKILVFASVPAGAQASSTSLILGLKRGSTNLYAGGFGFAQLYTGSSTNTYAAQPIMYLDSPSTTSSTTYTVTFSTTNGTVFPNNADGTITLMEIR